MSNTTKNNESISMKQLRQDRRKKGLCAQCGKTKSVTYVCASCSHIRKTQKKRRTEKRLAQGICVQCAKASIVNTDKGLCDDCNNIYPHLPIRKRRSWEVKNHALFQVMMEKSCSTKELAEVVGVSQNQVSRWIFKNAIPKTNNAHKAARYLNEEAEHIFHGLKST
ncbi:helix-turn-helix domain-containing protein [Paenibacillus hubeiensis]|uniref:helix-turn-helix domain-containing protein n=1 Tax=Paenibacillus hubeiensis TaxID=3077330 RepID=UPI0031BA51F9